MNSLDSNPLFVDTPGDLLADREMHVRAVIWTGSDTPADQAIITAADNHVVFGASVERAGKVIHHNFPRGLLRFTGLKVSRLDSGALLIFCDCD